MEPCENSKSRFQINRHIPSETEWNLSNFSASGTALKTFKETFEVFLRDKTLIEAAEGVIEGSDESRIDRAAQGEKGGLGDRKDWPMFIAAKLSAISNHLSHWDAMTVTQRAKIISEARDMINGKELTISTPDRFFTQQRPIWPKEFCIGVQEAIRERLRNKPSENF